MPAPAHAPRRLPPPLRLEPFRATSYAVGAVSSLAAVTAAAEAPGHVLHSLTAPPYDLIDRNDRARWHRLDPHHITRVTVPPMGISGEPDHDAAAATLRQWREQGVLTTDRRPALYVYEMTGNGVSTVGVVGAISLHETGEGRVLPHEDVAEGPVHERAHLMRTVEAQLEPILLTYRRERASATPGVEHVIDRARTEPPWREVHVEDLTGRGAVETHRLWRLADARDHRVVQAAVSDATALIADGHHRYHAYLQIRDHLPGSASGLALLVDADRHPLTLRGIHRSVRSLTFDDALRGVRALPGASVEPFSGDVRQFCVSPPEVAPDGSTPEPARFILTDGARWVLVRLSRARPDEPDAAVLQPRVLEAAWGVPNEDSRLALHHEETEAVRAASNGIAILLRPPPLRQVMRLATNGVLMPRKSTSFGPKPRSGLLIRMLEH
ncbi:MAG TPA: DUF1015 domain-containing protein [Jiangellaceae bacterium]|nr:DUF1015 domain-containing protein [Jiangellaceae bacterium]